MTNYQLALFVFAVLSPCIGGFFYLNKRLDMVAKDVKENHVIQGELRRIFKSLEKIEITLSGNMENVGVIGMLRDHDQAITRIQERCKVEHG